MVVISDHYDINKETMFDVTRLTSFLEKDASFLTPWSWNPKTSSTKEKKYLSFHPESYFSYEVLFFIDYSSLNITCLFLFYFIF
jgi:hypothetical protein